MAIEGFVLIYRQFDNVGGGEHDAIYVYFTLVSPSGTFDDRTQGDQQAWFLPPGPVPGPNPDQAVMRDVLPPGPAPTTPTGPLYGSAPIDRTGKFWENVGPPMGRQDIWWWDIISTNLPEWANPFTAAPRIDLQAQYIQLGNA